MSPPPVVHASWAMILLAVALVAPPLVCIFLARRGRIFHIRRIPGIDAIEEALGRATELGRPIVFTTGMLDSIGALLYAVLGILSHISRKAAAFACRLIVPQISYEVMPVVEATVREAYRSAGRLDQFNPQEIRYLSSEQFAFASGYMGIVHREQAASCFLFGSFYAESLVLAEAGQQVGAMQVAGTTDLNQIPFFLTSCDYTIIGEEVFAAGAYLSRDPAQLGSVRGQDVAKLVILGVLLAGVISATAAVWKSRDTRDGEKFANPFAQALYFQPQRSRALARVEARTAYEPSRPPGLDDPESEDLAGALARSRSRLSEMAGRGGRFLGRFADLTAEQERSLRADLGLFSEGPAREAAAKVADQLKAVADRAKSDAAYFAALRAAETPGGGSPPASLPGIERACAQLARRRAAELAGPEIRKLEIWTGPEGPEAKRQPPLIPAATLDRCRTLVAEARRVLNDDQSGAERIERAVRLARRACQDAYFEVVRRRMAEYEQAAEGRPARVELRTGEREQAFKDRRRAEVTARVTAELAADEEFKKLTDEKKREDQLKKTVEGALDEEAARAGAKSFPLMLDAGKSVSGRGRPLPFEFNWAIEPAPSAAEKPPKLTGPQVPVLFDKPGTYLVKLDLSEVRAEPKPVVLAVEGNAASSVKYETLAAGTELKLTWRLASSAVPGSQQLVWDFGDQTEAKKGPDLTVAHKYARPGAYPLTVTVTYEEKVETAAASGAAPATGGDETGRLRSARGMLGAGLGKLADRLATVNGLLGDMEKEASEEEASGGYVDKLKPYPGLSKEAWPDREFAGELAKRLRQMREWADETSRFLDSTAAAADTLGVAAPAPSRPAPGAAAPAGGPKPAATRKCWKRSHCYFRVVEAAAGQARLFVEVREARDLPVAPWEVELPKPEARPAAEGAQEGGR